MLPQFDQRSTRALHFALALLIALEGVFNLAQSVSPERDALLITFGLAETLGALLLMSSRTIVVGACILVCAFLSAAGVHVLEHDLPFDHLVYAVAVLVVLAQQSPLGSQRSAA